MVKLDLKDKKILYQLDINSRQSFSQIGKKVGLSKAVVDYRVKRLEEQGIIKNYYTLIDSFKLGYEVLRFYIIYQYTTSDIEKEIIDYFVNSKHTWVVYSIQGWFDLDVIIWIKDRNEFYNFWKEMLNNYGDYFQNQILSYYIKAHSFRPSYLLSDVYDKAEREKVVITGGGKKVDIDDLDFRILRLIAPNARISITEIARKLNKSIDVVKYRLKKLLKLDVIQGFRANIDTAKLGYQYFKVDIYLREYKQRKEIINYIKLNPHLMCINSTTGLSDLELEFHLENLPHLSYIMRDITNKFPNAVRNYKYSNAKKVHKLVWMPQE